MKTSARLSDKLKHIGHGLILALLILLPAVNTTICAQDNYEIQVYGSETIPAGVTMVELHNNFTSTGEKKVVDGFASHARDQTRL
jgi:cytochrome b561